MWKKRFLTFLLLLSFVYSYVGASELQQGLTDIESYAINIQNNSLQQKTLIENLKIDLAESQKSLEEYQKQQEQILRMQEGLLKQLNDYEQKCKNWKVFAIVTIPLTIIMTTTITYLVLNNK